MHGSVLATSAFRHKYTKEMCRSNVLLSRDPLCGARWAPFLPTGEGPWGFQEGGGSLIHIGAKFPFVAMLVPPVGPFWASFRLPLGLSRAPGPARMCFQAFLGTVLAQFGNRHGTIMGRMEQSWALVWPFSAFCLELSAASVQRVRQMRECDGTALADLDIDVGLSPYILGPLRSLEPRYPF